MKKWVSLVVMLLGLLSLVHIAVAQEDYWFEYDNGEVIFYVTLPGGWSGEWQEEEGVSILHALPEDESVYLSLWALHDVADLQDAAEAVDGIIEQLFTDAKWGEWEEWENNGIPFLTSDATAKTIDDNTLVDLSASFFSPAEGEIYLLIYFGTPEAWHEHKEEIEEIYGSIRTEE